MGGDPELEAAAAAERRAKQVEEGSEEEEGSDEDDWDPKDVKEVAKKQRQMARGGITFESKMGTGAKVNLIFPLFVVWPQASEGVSASSEGGIGNEFMGSLLPDAEHPRHHSHTL